MNADDNQNHDTARVLGRIEALNRRLEQQAAAARQRQGVMLAAVALLAVVMSFGMTQMVALADSLDVQTVAYIGRQQMQEHLPSGRQALQAALASQAPELVSQALTSAIGSVPAMRSMLVERMTGQFSDVNQAFEAKTLQHMRHAITTARQSIEASHPELDSPQREIMVARAAARDVSASFRKALTQLYPEYASRMHQFTERVNHLASTPPEQMSARDRQQRELIETALRLAVRAKTEAF